MLALTLACLFAAPASAHYREACWVQYRLPWWDTWSGTFAVVCDYHTGRELNERAGGQDFASYKEYAIITIAGAGNIVIRINQSLSCGFVAESPCAEKPSHLLYGRDEYDFTWRGRRVRRDWAICQPGVMGVCTAQGFR